MLIWILGIGAGCLVLAALLHFVVPAGKAKVPAFVIGTIGGFVVGAVTGMFGAVYYGETLQRSVYGELYKPGPMPTKGAMKGMNPPPQPKEGEAAPKKTSGAAKKAGGGPGAPNLPSDYPKPDDSSKKTEGESAPKT